MAQAKAITRPSLQYYVPSALGSRLEHGHIWRASQDRAGRCAATRLAIVRDSFAACFFRHLPSSLITNKACTHATHMLDYRVDHPLIGGFSIRMSTGLVCSDGRRDAMGNLIAPSAHAKYFLRPSFRPICTRLCFAMTNVIQVCSNFDGARVFIINTRPGEILSLRLVK